jgi:hypothetical protein
LKNGLFVRLIFIIDHFSSPSEVDYLLDGQAKSMNSSKTKKLLYHHRIANPESSQGRRAALAGVV